MRRLPNLLQRKISFRRPVSLNHFPISCSLVCGPYTCAARNVQQQARQKQAQRGREIGKPTSLVSHKVTPKSAAFVRTVYDCSLSKPPKLVYEKDIPMHPSPCAETESSPILRCGYLDAMVVAGLRELVEYTRKEDSEVPTKEVGLATVLIQTRNGLSGRNML